MSKTRAVNNPRHSQCGSAKLSELNWSEWWTDDSWGNYLHVASKDGETSHRVFCRHGGKPRLGMIGGQLVWLID